MSNTPQDILTIHVNVQITAAALQSVVGHAKRIAKQSADGVYHIDTADQVSAMISKFLAEKNFDAYVRNADNYIPQS